MTAVVTANTTSKTFNTRVRQMIEAIKLSCDSKVSIVSQMEKSSLNQIVQAGVRVQLSEHGDFYISLKSQVMLTGILQASSVTVLLIIIKQYC